MDNYDVKKDIDAIKEGKLPPGWELTTESELTFWGRILNRIKRQL